MEDMYFWARGMGWEEGEEVEDEGGCDEDEDEWCRDPKAQQISAEM